MKGIRRRAILIHVIGAIIARAAFFHMNPLAIGYFTAAYLGKAGGGFALIAVLIGAATVMDHVQLLKIFFTMVTTVVIVESPIIKRFTIPQPILYAIAPAILGLFSFMEIVAGHMGNEDILLAALEALIAFISAAIFQSGIDFVLRAEKGFRMNNEEMVSMALMVAVVIYAIPNLPFNYFALVETGVYFIILFFTYKYGVGQGAITGAVCGLAMSLRGMPIADIGIFAMMGIVPAIFRELGRIPTSIIYVTMATVMGLVLKNMTFTIQETGAIISAVILFLLLPKSIIYRVEVSGSNNKEEYLASMHLKKMANIKMKLFSDSFLKLSKTLDTIAEKQIKLKKQEVNHIFEDISERLCRDCNQCNQCWDNNFDETYQATCKMFDIIEKNGFIDREDIPTHFMNDCISAEEFIKEANRGFEIAKLNYIWYNRISESREVIAEQLKEVSLSIQEVTSDIYEARLVMKEVEDKLRRRLKSEHISIKDITIIERGDKRKEIYLTAACRRGNCVTTREVAFLIGEVLGIKMKVSEASKTVIKDTYDNYNFVEDTKFKVLTGVARTMKETVSGDNFSILKMENGQIMIAMSDGMGTGKEAGEESEAVMSLLEQMIESGFKAETAIKLINSNLVLKSDKQTFSTIDMSMINLFTGMCEFIKIGAASAFIKRDDWVETISSTTLPIGMFSNVDYDAVTKKLYPGDIIIMVTDGILDSIHEDNKEAYLEHLIMDIKSNNPQEIANRILDHALTLSNYIPMDDMTIITAGMWLK